MYEFDEQKKLTVKQEGDKELKACFGSPMYYIVLFLCASTFMWLISSTISAACPPVGLYGTVIMRCKQTACPVPPADILISFPQARKKGRERVWEMKRGRDKEAEGIEEIKQGLSWQGQRCSECENNRKQKENWGDSNSGKRRRRVREKWLRNIKRKEKSDYEREGETERERWRWRWMGALTEAAAWESERSRKRED